ncbi:MAG: cob(I)yrinic acid a,c-diamide adenosyltransferase, partial [Propionibacteriaceae bacterium]|nr:cob(I)yrinic acid a,c-diamide adenosyltransferase [Propionibacteriaceae bacterium]
MVNLTRIYTRTGDGGQTTLTDLSRTSKTDPRVEAYGAVDEANSLLGLVLAEAELPEEIAAVVHHVQNELFDVGADLSNPRSVAADDGSLRIIQACVGRLEGWCDDFDKELPALRSFVLPGGNRAAALLHCARAVVRRAEREAWRIDEANPLAITYLNRLSDLLFIFARTAAQSAGEVLWVPGKDRQPPEGLPSARREQIKRQQDELNP